jgi:hypothetical protein
VAYHFTDVVSFVSRDQFIIFDPHAKFLPGQAPGLRVNYLQNGVSETVCDVLEVFLILFVAFLYFMLSLACVFFLLVYPLVCSPPSLCLLASQSM